MASDPTYRFAAHHLETIKGKALDLIPYEKKHVEMFHAWLQDASLADLVSTPAVSLEADHIFQEEAAHSTDKMIKLIQLADGSGRIIGDIDMFFNADGGAEINLMIVDRKDRRKGYASEALTLAMQYAIQKFQITLFVAKIDQKNAPSIRLFEKMGFSKVRNEPNVFGEYEFHLDAGNVPSANLQIESSFLINP